MDCRFVSLLCDRVLSRSFSSISCWSFAPLGRRSYSQKRCGVCVSKKHVDLRPVACERCHRKLHEMRMSLLIALFAGLLASCTALRPTSINTRSSRIMRQQLSLRDNLISPNEIFFVQALAIPIGAYLLIYIVLMFQSI